MGALTGTNVTISLRLMEPISLPPNEYRRLHHGFRRRPAFGAGNTFWAKQVSQSFFLHVVSFRVQHRG